MTNEDLIKEINLLPDTVRRRIEKIIADTRKQPREESKESGSRTPLSEHPFVGMWKDREDMKEGGAVWVRKLRREQWDRSHKWIK